MSRLKTNRRIVGEFLLIVVGVVTALGVDRWVQNIDDARSEREYLTLILGDVEANLRIFETMQRDWDAARDATRDLLEVLENPTQRPADAGLFIAVARAGTVNTLPARDGSFRDLESTGNLRLVTSPELRGRIVDYFTQEIRFGRPGIENRLDLRFRTFAREYFPADLPGHRILCPHTTPALECTFDASPLSDHLWSAFTSHSSMAQLLNARLADAVLGANLITTWTRVTRELQEALRATLAQ